MRALHRALSQCQANPRTGGRFILPILVDNASSLLGAEQFCSLVRNGVSRGAILYLSFDEAGCRRMGSAGAECAVIDPVIPFRNKNERFKVKLHLLCLQNWWGLEAFTLDSDIIFFDNVLEAFEDDVDIEMSSDGDLAVKRTRDTSHLINSGFGRFMPTVMARAVLRDIWSYGRNQTLLPDQIVHQMTYNKLRERGRLLNGTEFWDSEEGTVSFKVVQPFRVACGGLAFCRGAKRFWSDMSTGRLLPDGFPVAIHYNYHMMPIKYVTHRFLGLDMCNAFNGTHRAAFKEGVGRVQCRKLSRRWDFHYVVN